MTDRQILIDQAGPLPITTSLVTGSNGGAMLFVSGSAWTQESAGQIGVAVSVDGQKVGEAVIWSNESTEHRALVPVFMEITLDKQWPSDTQPPTYVIELTPLNTSSLTDVNDWFQLSLVA